MGTYQSLKMLTYYFEIVLKLNNNNYNLYVYCVMQCFIFNRELVTLEREHAVSMNITQHISSELYKCSNGMSD